MMWIGVSPSTRKAFIRLQANYCAKLMCSGVFSSTRTEVNLITASSLRRLKSGPRVGFTPTPYHSSLR